MDSVLYKSFYQCKQTKTNSNSNSNSRLLRILSENTDKTKYDTEINNIRHKDPSSINKIDRFICFYPDIFWNIYHGNNYNYYIVLSNCRNKYYGNNFIYTNKSMKSICDNESDFLEMIELIDNGSFRVTTFNKV